MIFFQKEELGMATVTFDGVEFTKIVTQAVEKQDLLEKNTDLSGAEQALTKGFINLVLEKATNEAVKGFLDNTYGDLMKGQRTKGDILKSAQATSNAFGDFLEVDLFGVSQGEEGRATTKGDLADVFNLGLGRYELKGTAGTKIIKK